MANVILVGAQWGDEGKGKVVDILAQRADVIVRFQGGNNAGHTLIVGGRKRVLHLVPSGVLHPDKVCMIGNGVVVDLAVLHEEVESLQRDGVSVTPANLRMSDRAHIIMPYHVVLDGLLERKRGEHKIGTTGRGIGPAYIDKIARQGLRVGDLKNVKTLEEKLASVLSQVNEVLTKLYHAQPLALKDVLETLKLHRSWLLPHVADISQELDEARRLGRHVLLEGAQGSWLDVDHGTYPYVTSSNTVAGAACIGAGIGPTHIDRVVGVTKAYVTRVGEGPFPTELMDKQGEYLQSQGQEFGATTGRPRRCGWLDAVALKRAVVLNGMTDLVVTKLDVLSGLDTVKIAVGYQSEQQSTSIKGKELNGTATAPVYETLPGWPSFPPTIKNIDELPTQAQVFLQRLQSFVDVPIAMVSTGPRREDCIIQGDVFAT